jgi:hypothetical protein
METKGAILSLKIKVQTSLCSRKCNPVSADPKCNPLFLERCIPRIEKCDPLSEDLRRCDPLFEDLKCNPLSKALKNALNSVHAFGLENNPDNESHCTPKLPPNWFQNA